MLETSAKASFEWARRVGLGWRLEGRDVPENAALLLGAAFAENHSSSELRSGEMLRQHDRSLGVAAVLSGLSPGALITRAMRDGRTSAFAEAAAWAWSVGDREPAAFAIACRRFRELKLDWDDGVAAALEGMSDAARGPVYQRARRHTVLALARNETWAVVGRLRAKHARDIGFADGARAQIDSDRLLRDASYRNGVAAGITVAREVGPEAVAAELRTRRR